MSHEVNSQIQEDLQTGIAGIVMSFQDIKDYINADRERLELLTPREIIFLNKISKAIKELDQNGTN